MVMSINDFLTTLVKEKHADTNLEEFQIVDMIKSLSERLTKFITLAVLTEFATKDTQLLVKFQGLIKETATPEVIHAFVEKEIPDGAAFLAKVLTDFRALYLGPSEITK